MSSEVRWTSGWLKWCPTSAIALEKAEQKLLSYLKQPFELQFIDIPAKGANDIAFSIQTLHMNVDAQEDKEKIPLVLLHGLASGLGLWILNLDSLSQNRPLYAFDIPGFGRSSRPNFSKNEVEVEKQFVESIEKWRGQMGIQKFILLGHSLGGYLASSYALQYPARVHHLILADPWGFPERGCVSKRVRLPFYVKPVATVLQHFNPLAGLRAAGPLGPKIIEKARFNFLQSFSATVEDVKDVSNYIYHCNAQVPSGEEAFKILSSGLGWAKSPMSPRIIKLSPEVPITFIYGSKSWIDCETGFHIKELRKESYVDIKMIHGAGHHLNAEKAEEFNSVVKNICDRTTLNNYHKEASENYFHEHMNGSVQPHDDINVFQSDEKVASGSLVL